MSAEVEVVAGAHVRRTFPVIGGRDDAFAQEHEQRIDTFVVYVQKFREVGHGRDRVD